MMHKAFFKLSLLGWFPLGITVRNGKLGLLPDSLHIQDVTNLDTVHKVEFKPMQPCVGIQLHLLEQVHEVREMF